MKLLLFDIDGTLMMSKGAGRIATKRAIQEVFGTLGQIDSVGFGGLTDWQIVAEALASEGFSLEDIGARMDVYAQALARHMAEVLPQHEVHALPGALALVAECVCRSDLIVGLVTGNTALSAPIKLRAAGFNPSDFVVAAYGSEAHDRNQLPFLALERAERLTGRHILASDVLVIGDTLADLRCAQALGARSVIVLTGFEDPDALRQAQPDFLIPDLTHFWDAVRL
ncbi:MAG: HAD hydrolase-like protein [Anaerolineae bacterium]|nr:HAD hydrolase-like protein [Anaerolineae bacterium]MDW8171211.1 HAD hydrolase-like protein [Anaerolineae bacterium]